MSRNLYNYRFRDMMFLLRNMRQKLRDFTADFCTQLSSKHMDEAFASQVCQYVNLKDRNKNRIYPTGQNYSLELILLKICDC